MTSKEQSDNPFQPEAKADSTDRPLVEEAVGGDQSALESLIRRHQPWIYNLALRMVMVPDDADDVTQEVLVKIVAQLEESYQDEVDSRFRELFRTHPFYSGKDMIPWLRELLGSPEFKDTFTLN